MVQQAVPSGRIARHLAAAVALVLAYVLSSGPVLAIAFWLRESTHWDGFYAVMWFYYPLLAMGHDNLVDGYVSWWCSLLGAVGPG